MDFLYIYSDEISKKEFLEKNGANSKLNFKSFPIETFEVPEKKYPLYLIDCGNLEGKALELASALSVLKESRVFLFFSHSDEAVLKRFSPSCTLFYKDPYGLYLNQFVNNVRMIVSRDKIRESSNMYKQELDFLKYIIDHNPASIIITDVNGVIEYVNKKFTRVTGYKKEEVIGKNPRILQSGYQSPEYYRKLWTAISNKKTWRGEFHNRKKDGEYFWELSSISPLLNEEGEVTKYVAIKEDITRLKLAQYKLVSAKMKAEQAAQAKSTFLANMSHEIRTPLNAIMGMIELLKETSVDREQKEYLDTIHSSAGILLNVINDILDFSKIEANKVTIENSDIDLYTVVEDSLDVISFEAFNKKLHVVNKISTDVVRFLKGDGVRFRQILVNLLNNAVKFTEKGEITVAVSQVSQQDSKVVIKVEVTDTGIGISEEELRTIFETFTQIDSSSSRKFGGTGLGLAICKRLTELLGGEIGVESRFRKGSTFWFTCCMEEGRNQDSSSFRTGLLEGKKVFIISDNKSELDTLSYYLEFMGGQTDSHYCPSSVNTASVIKESLEKAGDVDFVIFGDFFLEDSFSECLNELTRYKSEHSVYLILLLYAGAIKKEIEGIADELIIKPLKVTKLYDMLENLIKGTKKEPLSAGQGDNKPEQTLYPGVKILLAEDNKANQKLFKIIVQKLGALVSVAEDGEEAVRMFRQSAYDIIFMDIQMPNMNGYEAARIIRSENPDIPIVGISANVFQEDIENGIAAGMNDYISKPFKKALICEKIAEVSNSVIPPAGAGEEGNSMEKQDSEQGSINPYVFNYKDLLDNYMGEKEIVDDVLQVFIGKVDGQITKIGDSIEQGDLETVVFEAHSIKGSAYNITAKEVGDIAKGIEHSGKDGDLGRVKEFFKNFRQKFEILKKVIQKNIT